MLRWTLIVLLAVGGCSVSASVSYQASTTTVRVPKAPPAPQEETRPEQTEAGTEWCPGSWHWQGDAWVWVGGEWKKPPSAGQTWQPSVVTEVAGGFDYTPGRWSGPTAGAETPEGAAAVAAGSVERAQPVAPVPTLPKPAATGDATATPAAVTPTGQSPAANAAAGTPTTAPAAVTPTGQSPAATAPAGTPATNKPSAANAAVAAGGMSPAAIAAVRGEGDKPDGDKGPASGDVAKPALDADGNPIRARDKTPPKPPSAASNTPVTAPEGNQGRNTRTIPGARGDTTIALPIEGLRCKLKDRRAKPKTIIRMEGEGFLEGIELQVGGKPWRIGKRTLNAIRARVPKDASDGEVVLVYKTSKVVCGKLKIIK